MKINNLFPRSIRRLNEIEYGECFVYNNILYMKIAISDLEKDEWKDAALSLSDGYADIDMPFQDPIVEYIDVELNIIEVLN